MKIIRHTATLYYYDGPQVFEARDGIGGHYVAVMIDPDGKREQFIVAGIEPERLRQFRMGRIDLRSLLLERGEAEWFVATTEDDLDAPLSLKPQNTPLAAFPQLPDSGFVLHDKPAISEALREARSRNNLVLEIAVEPPEAAGEHRIHAATLAGLLVHLQTMVKHAYATALRDLSPGTRSRVDSLDAHLLDVIVPASTGSFRVTLEAAKKPDLLSQNELARALERVDGFFDHVADPQRTLQWVKANRGHLAGAYLRLLRFLVQSKTGLYYSWAEPSFSDPRSRNVLEAEAGPLVDVLSGVSNLSAETVVFVGSLKKADVDNRAWRLATPEGDVSGKIKDGGPSLGGLKLDASYRFTCLEETEEVQGGIREQRTYYLTDYEAV